MPRYQGSNGLLGVVSSGLDGEFNLSSYGWVGEDDDGEELGNGVDEGSWTVFRGAGP